MSASFKITGTVHALMDTKQVSERFRKREFALVVPDGKYPQTLLLECTGDNISQLDVVSVGDEVNVEINLRGREWTSPKGETKFFNTLVAWRVERVAQPQPSAPQTRMDEAPGFDSDADSLPF